MTTRMLLELGAAGLIAAGGALGMARQRRARLYKRQRAEIATIRESRPLSLQLDSHGTPDFSRSLVRVPDFLPPDLLSRIRTESLGLRAPERSYVPAHKRGGTAAYDTLIAGAPSVVAYYHAPELMAFFSRVVGATVGPTPIHDQSSLSILHYDRPLDHIGWHYDHNFYRGRHFTALLSIVNDGGAADGLSHAVLIASLDGREVPVSTEPNTLVLFEGAVVRHKVSPLQGGERRVVLSMTCCTDPRSHPWQGIARRFKDTAYYGVRALWT